MSSGFMKDSPALSRLLQETNALVSYVRDDFGYYKGVVVAIGKKKIGYSLVKLSRDVLWVRVKPHQLPVINKMFQEGHSLEEIAKTAPYQKCESEHHIVRIPQFDKRIGLLFALDSAMKSEIKWMDCGIDEPMFTSPFPKDDDLRKVFAKMINRANRYYKEES